MTSETNGEALRQQRRGAGISLNELASRLGVTASHLSRVERGERPPSTRIQRGYAELVGIRQPTEQEGRRGLEVIFSERHEVHLLATCDLDWYDTWTDVEVLGDTPRPWLLTAGARRTVAETAYEVLAGPELSYRDTARTTTVTLQLPPGHSRIGIRTWAPSDTNILTFEVQPKLRVLALEYVVHVPAEVTSSLDLRRIEHLPPDMYQRLPLRYQRPARVLPETRIGFTDFLSGHFYGIGWMLPSFRTQPES